MHGGDREDVKTANQKETTHMTNNAHTVQLLLTHRATVGAGITRSLGEAAGAAILEDLKQRVQVALQGGSEVQHTGDLEAAMDRAYFCLDVVQEHVLLLGEKYLEAYASEAIPEDHPHAEIFQRPVTDLYAALVAVREYAMPGGVVESLSGGRSELLSILSVFGLAPTTITTKETTR